MYLGRRLFIAFLASSLVYLGLTGLVLHYDKHSARPAALEEERLWIKSSKSWLDRQTCRWVGICGAMHLNSANWTWSMNTTSPSEPRDGSEPPPSSSPRNGENASDYWTSGPENPESWSDKERAKRHIPNYVLDYAPYVHLFSGEQFWPCDIAEHLANSRPSVNYTELTGDHAHVNISNLNNLNTVPDAGHGRFMYLTSIDNVEERPAWLGGTKNIPRSPAILGGDHDDEGDDGHLWAAEAGGRDDDVRSKGWEQGPWSPPVLPPSTNGRCGGSSGFSCSGSAFGSCCSIYGWCGGGEMYCGEPCDPMGGDCNDPFEINPHPHQDLRKRHIVHQDEDDHGQPHGKSAAPAILVVVNKGDGIVDAFWFFFYSFNLGQTVANARFGNHIGDWEHIMIRFRNGKPTEVALSEHDFGQAFTWEALEKYVPTSDGSGTMMGTWSNTTSLRIAKRPVVYSAVGSHAMYARPGVHPYILPWGMLHDQTDRGPLWDPSLNFQSFTWDLHEQKVRASELTPKAPTEWFNYGGHWGDKFYELSDPRQYRFAGQYHYVNGPTGPRFKNLGRSNVCQGMQKCTIRQWASGSRARRIPSQEDTEEGQLPGGNMTDGTAGMTDDL